MGWIIPEPLAIAPMRTGRPSIRTSACAALGCVSVVIMARDALSPPSSERVASASSIPADIFCMGRRTPMTPVELGSTSSGAQPIWPAIFAQISRASSIPSGPTQAFALPALTYMARAQPPATCSRETSRLWPLTTFFVKTPAQEASLSLVMMHRSSLPSFFRPHALAAA